MPELPEVETIRRQLEPALRGRRIESAEVLDPRWSRPVAPREIELALAGRRIERVERRGKYLLLGLDGGRTLAMHLRMTGNVLLAGGEPEVAGGEGAVRAGAVADEASIAPRHLRAVLRLEGGTRLLFTDPRRFGHGVVLGDAELDRYLGSRLGVEPLSDALTADELCRLAAGRRAPLKSFLLNQLGIAGIGNIYADEALHRAALHPLSPAGSMKPQDCERLRRGIVEALEAGLRRGGASVDDYRDARGARGTMQDEFLVHAREGAPCPRCGAEIRRIVVAGRSTYFCPSCQRRLRRRRRRAAPRVVR
ncbi:MAG TPA: bifunctional DNA-formamidopyrimidine glycosylase/DNA-(apurinic or apyrimidinic site) lyase [Solirubrobacterales bacterium]|nr:bifunctional DNA-formamidopyrimidine glycosylase/DNA-(apurinic or apyrimidinic site) lyase [Solirubrobacterales bacterium]